MATLIESLDQLKQLAGHEDGLQCFITLNFGCRSSKIVWYDAQTKKWDVFNEIDDSRQENLTDKTLATKTHIIEAIEKNALFQY